MTQAPHEDGIRWEDPPPEPPRRRSWAEHLIPLMEHPKRWAIVGEGATYPSARTTVYNLRRRLIKLPAGGWEFTARTVDGEHRVYARYLGPDEDGDAS